MVCARASNRHWCALRRRGSTSRDRRGGGRAQGPGLPLCPRAAHLWRVVWKQSPLRCAMTACVPWQPRVAASHQSTQSPPNAGPPVAIGCSVASVPMLISSPCRAPPCRTDVAPGRGRAPPICGTDVALESCWRLTSGRRVSGTAGTGLARRAEKLQAEVIPRFHSRGAEKSGEVLSEEPSLAPKLQVRDPVLLRKPVHMAFGRPEVLGSLLGRHRRVVAVRHACTVPPDTGGRQMCRSVRCGRRSQGLAMTGWWQIESLASRLPAASTPGLGQCGAASAARIGPGDVVLLHGTYLPSHESASSGASGSARRSA